MAALGHEDGPMAPGAPFDEPQFERIEAPADKDDDGDDTVTPRLNVAISETGVRLEMALPAHAEPIGEEAFRARYLAAMREAQRARHEAMLQRAAADGVQPPVAAAAAPAAAAAAGGGAGNGEALALADLFRGLPVGRIAGSLMKIAFAAFLFGQRSGFVMWFGILCAFKLGSLLFTSVKFRTGRDSQRRYVHPDDEHFSDDDDNHALGLRAAGDLDARAELVKRRAAFNADLKSRRRQLLVRKSLKCVTTFFVSVFPSWRIENLHAELIRDGLMRDEAKRRRQREQPPAAVPEEDPAGEPQAEEGARE